MIHGPYHSQSHQGGKVVQDARGDKTASSQTAHTEQAGSRKEAPAGETSRASGASSGNVSLSKEAMMMQKLDQSLSEAEDVDKSKVVAIRERIERGDFTINSEVIASKMLSIDSLY